MGFYGWASSPHEPTMDANVGAHDGMAAVQWTKRYISKFGGDPERITVMGQSAGAAIINSFLTSYGGKGDLPFAQVCSQLLP
jgi:carboxylesterase type B